MDRRNFLKRTTAGTVVFSFRPPPLISSAAAGSPEGPLRLHTNENPRGLSPRVREAIRQSLADAHQYPFSLAEDFREKLAAHHAVTARNIILGSGSSEVLQMAVQSVATPESLVIMAEPTFESVAVFGLASGTKVKTCPLRADYSHDLPRMQRLARQHEGKALIYICNPNNPTGTLTPSSEIEEWLDSADLDTYFLIDEAYHHYVDSRNYYSFVSQAAERSNVIVTRTFSKVHALAGLRLGYGVTNPNLKDRLELFAPLPNVNHVALHAGKAALEDRDFLHNSVRLNRRARRILHRTLQELRIHYLAGEANFVMFRLDVSLERFRRRMEREGILVGRPFPPMIDHCRVSLGLPQEMERFDQLMRSFRQKGWV